MDIDAGSLKLVSRGTNSGIYRLDSEGKALILKMVPTSALKEARHLSNEFSLLTRIQHPNVIRALRYKRKVVVKNETGTEGEKLRDVLVLENASQGSLLSWLARVKLNAAHMRWVAGQLCEGVNYLHCNYIVHRDLKLENVLVHQAGTQIQIKIGDLGLSTLAQQTSFFHEYRGTRRAYMAPEIHAILQKPQPYDVYKADIFALAVIFFSLVFGKLPFEYALPQNTHYRHIAANDPKAFWGLHEAASMKMLKQEEATEEQVLLPDFKRLFWSMVQLDPARRPTIQEVLESEWLQGPQQIVTASDIGTK